MLFRERRKSRARNNRDGTQQLDKFLNMTVLLTRCLGSVTGPIQRQVLLAELRTPIAGKAHHDGRCDKRGGAHEERELAAGQLVRHGRADIRHAAIRRSWRTCRRRNDSILFATHALSGQHFLFTDFGTFSADTTRMLSPVFCSLPSGALGLLRRSGRCTRLHASILTTPY